MNGLPQMSMNEVYGITDTLHSATGSSVWLHRLLPSPQWWIGAKGMVTHFLLELPTCSKAALGPVRRTNKDRGMSRSCEFLDILHCGRHQSAILRCMSCGLQPVFCLWIDIDPDRRTHFFARRTVAVESLLQFSWHTATAACEQRW